MVMKRSALGRGLDALITMDDLKTGGSSSIRFSPIRINPVLFLKKRRLKNWPFLSVHWVSFSRLR